MKALPVLKSAVLTLALQGFSFGEGFVTSSLEQMNYQVNGEGGSGSLVLRSYEAWDEIDGFNYEAGGVTGLTLQINDGAIEPIAFNAEFGTYKRGVFYDTLPELESARPQGATYTHTLEGTPSGPVVIAAPNVSYTSAIPNNPHFTISGTNGTWHTQEDGMGVFRFDANTTESFTITMNAYQTPTSQGEHYGSSLFVADVTSDYNNIGEISTGVLASGVESEVFTLTFTRGAFVEGDPDGRTNFQFTAGSRFEFEGEHFNIFDLSPADGISGAQKAFIYQNVTSFNIEAIPEPSSLLLSSVAALLLFRRRRN